VTGCCAGDVITLIITVMQAHITVMQAHIIFCSRDGQVIDLRRFSWRHPEGSVMSLIPCGLVKIWAGVDYVIDFLRFAAVH
jgi:hypothetical protein